ncbi:hypothetical protein LTS18_010986 [Coniosporium uncinatum]|uniref:Uncharacterized protein n=1 Tax=Coniosporium uncinatum TaxID=93489 RepID=A0ACC3DKG2_9PEZI|nr:hypothetical protein LTS18_010986 [Coniosporium uncinatum]
MTEVLAIPELLELILLNLPSSDVLRLTNVSRAFNHLIKHSHGLQGLQYFRANCSLFPNDDGIAFFLNPLLEASFPGWLSSVNRESNVPEHLRDANEPFTRSRWSRYPEAFRCHHASWRDMLITQPPIERIHIIKTRFQRYYEETEEHAESTFALQGHDGGLRMGTLYDYIQHAVLRETNFRPRFDIAIGPGVARLTESFDTGRSAFCLEVPGGTNESGPLTLTLSLRYPWERRKPSAFQALQYRSLAFKQIAFFSDEMAEVEMRKRIGQH